MKLQKILLTTDFSECAERAYRAAVDLARFRGAELALVHVEESVPQVLAEYVRVDSGAFREGMRKRLAAEAAKPVFAGTGIKSFLIEGDGAAAVADFQREREYDLICVATHGRGAFRHLVMGSFAERLVRLATAPVLTLRASPQARHFEVKRILYPVDFSAQSLAALDAVRFFSDLCRAKIIVYHVLPAELAPAPDFAVAVSLNVHFPGFWEKSEADAKRRLAELVAKELPGRETCVRCAVGQPAQDIVRSAAEHAVDLIVLATHGRSGIEHALLGSVAERVVQKAPCAVLTVRPPKR